MGHRLRLVGGGELQVVQQVITCRGVLLLLLLLEMPGAAGSTSQLAHNKSLYLQAGKT